MPRNGSGTYNLPSNSWNPAITGAAATAADYQALINDIATALTQSLSRDGQATMTGPLNMGGNTVSGLNAPTGAGESLRWEQMIKGSDIPSAASITIPNEGALFEITGDATIETITDAYPGRTVILRFAEGITLEHSASLVIPWARDVVTIAGEMGVFVNRAPGIWEAVTLGAIESGSNENGSWTRWPDGTQECRVSTSVSLAINNPYANGLFQNTWSWTFPKAFVETPSVPSPSIRWGNSASWASIATTPSTTGVGLRALDAASRAADTTYISAVATGFWR